MYKVFEALLSTYGVSAYQVAKATGISTGSLSDWKKGRSSPKADKLQKIADYFGVTVDYLLGNEQNEQKEKSTAISGGLTEKDERDIGKKIEDILGLLKQGDGLTFDGNPLSEDALESIKAAMELGMRTAKLEAKAKYTSKKYRKED